MVKTNLEDNDTPMEIQLQAAPDSIQVWRYFGFHRLKDEPNLDDKTACKFMAKFLSRKWRRQDGLSTVFR